MAAKSERPARVVALAGGFGGAKLALGLQSALPRRALVGLVNKGTHFDPRVSPT